MGACQATDHHLPHETHEHKSECFQHYRDWVEIIGWSHTKEGDPKMKVFDRSGPCAPIDMVMPLLGSAVAFRVPLSRLRILVSCRRRTLGWMRDPTVVFTQTLERHFLNLASGLHFDPNTSSPL
jgi:hypothetical protein